MSNFAIQLLDNVEKDVYLPKQSTAYISPNNAILMQQAEFEYQLARLSDALSLIRIKAHEVHERVNQFYGGSHPYGYHLDMVADSVYKYGASVCAGSEDILPMFFGAYFHDSIEDARLTYNNVMSIAFTTCALTEQQAFMAAELVYALTNEKGRTRQERADERYYEGIRQTPYAPFVKAADRLANLTFSCSSTDEMNEHMRLVYARELPYFVAEICQPDVADMRLRVPQIMIDRMNALVNQ